MPTTGTPSISSNFFKSISILFFLASSIKFTQTTTFFVNSKICNTKFKFLSKLVASTTTVITSKLEFFIKSIATSSSSEYELNEYVPGKSTRVKFIESYSYLPTLLSIVFPVQFPVC